MNGETAPWMFLGGVQSRCRFEFDLGTKCMKEGLPVKIAVIGEGGIIEFLNAIVDVGGVVGTVERQ